MAQKKKKKKLVKISVFQDEAESIVPNMTIWQFLGCSSQISFQLGLNVLKLL
jgi:hypothetical protein